MRWNRWAPVGLLGLIMILAFIFLPVDPLIERFGAMPDAQTIPADTRIQIWRDTLPMIRAFPLFGCGLGSYESCFIRFERVAPMQTIDYAHNDYLQLAAELGLPGFVLVMALAVLAWRRIWRGIRGEERYLELACLGAVVAIGLHSFVDFGLHIPVNAMTLAWILGVAGAHSGRKRLELSLGRAWR